MFEGSEDEVQKWKEDIKERRSEDGRPLLNALQYEMVERFADQVCVELRARTINNDDDFQPLRWSLHGGPGTGKSHIIKIIKTELFEN
jgi:DNA replication protein DnaC